MTYSLSGFLFEDTYSAQLLSFDEFCRLARRLGYDGVELRRTQVSPETSTAERKQLLSTVKANRLSVTCLTTRGMPSSGDERDEFFLSYLDICKDLECGLLKTGGEHRWMCWAAERAEPFGVTVAKNNHVGTDIETVRGTREFLSACPSANVMLLYDPMHLFHGGEDYLGAIGEFYQRIANVLVHSKRKNDEIGGTATYTTEPCMPDDQAAQDWPAIFRELESVGYNGLVTVIENGWPEDEREGIARYNIEYLRSLE